MHSGGSLTDREHMLALCCQFIKKAVAISVDFI